MTFGPGQRQGPSVKLGGPNFRCTKRISIMGVLKWMTFELLARDYHFFNPIRLRFGDRTGSTVTI